MNDTLTRRQKEIFEYIRETILLGITPTYREIGDAFGFHVNSARNHVMTLKLKGYLTGDDAISRGIQLAKPAVTVTKDGRVFTEGGPSVDDVLNAIKEAKR